MAKVGVVGLGKVGLPLALALEQGGHEVVGYDIDQQRVRARLDTDTEDPEPGVSHWIREGRRRRGPFHLATHLGQVVKDTEVVFVVVQTQHRPGYGGETPMPATAADFDYRQLEQVLDDLGDEVEAEGRAEPLVVAVVSTVLPGTIRRLAHRAHPKLRLLYNPALISLGTITDDLVKPDFVLIGSDHPKAAALVAEVWASTVYPELLGGKVHHTSIESAELLKVALNAYLTWKITFANALAELCFALPGAHVDQVTDGLALSRKVTGRFGLKAGMGDGGPCRPRDVVALSWLADQLELSVDPFGWLVRAREGQTLRLAHLTASAAAAHDLPVGVLGMAYKPGSAITDGSAARLLTHYLTELGVPWVGVDPPDSERTVIDPHTDPAAQPTLVGRSAVYVLAVPHPEFLDLTYPPGSVVIDPHGLVPDQNKVTVLRVGR